MKKMPFLLLIVSSFFVITISNAQSAKPQTKVQTENKTNNAASPLEGAWLSVDNKSFYMYNANYFSDIAQDSIGIWRNTHAGSFTTVNNNTITHKILYSSFPDHIGALHTLEYEIKDDTLTMKWFKKIITAEGKDITASLPKGAQAK